MNENHNAVQKALANHIDSMSQAVNDAEVKMTEAKFYSKLDASISDAKAGNVIVQQDGETIDDFVNRLLCTD